MTKVIATALRTWADMLERTNLLYRFVTLHGQLETCNKDYLERLVDIDASLRQVVRDLTMLAHDIETSNDDGLTKGEESD